MLLNDDGRAPRPAVPTTFDGVVRPGASTDAEIARLQTAVRGGAPLEAQLAGAYLQKARETGDPSFYVRADGVLDRALARGPADPAELVEAAVLAAGRHDFDGALRFAERARALAPDSIAALPIMVDALVELGRYGEAERTLQQLIDRKPTLAAYARVSYFRELHGDLAGAADAMARAVSAGSGAQREPRLRRGRCWATSSSPAAGSPSARRAYGLALASVSGYVPALAGRARLAAARGDLAGAIAGWKKVVTLLPLPEYAIELGEAELAAGRRAAGRRDLALVDAQRALLAEAGVNSDVEFARFEADHGDRERRRWQLARAGVGAGAERALGRRARLGADPRRPPRRRPALGAPGAEARLARPDLPLPRRHRRR